jgi:hypothetical protein
MTKKIFTLTAILLTFAAQVFAQAPAAEDVFLPKIEKGPVGMIVYSVLGLIVLAAAFKMIDIITPGNLAKQIAEEKNLALAVVIAGAMLGISIIIASAII